MKYLRSLGLACGVLAAAYTAMAAPAARAENEKLRVSIIPINDVTPLFSAIKQGYFAEEGITIDTSPSTGGATGIPGLIASAWIHRWRRRRAGSDACFEDALGGSSIQRSQRVLDELARFERE